MLPLTQVNDLGHCCCKSHDRNTNKKTGAGLHVVYFGTRISSWSVGHFQEDWMKPLDLIQRTGMILVAGALTAAAGPVLAQAWQPTKTLQFIIPAGTGGGADQMARAIPGIVAKHKLMKQKMG